MHRTRDLFRKVVVFGALCAGLFRVAVADDYTYQSLTNLGPCASSRVLLMNNDTNPICPIEGQGYHDTDSNTVAVGQTYWWHDETPITEAGVSDIINLQAGVRHILYQKQEDGLPPLKLWELIDCRAGSSASRAATAFNYLPWSRTAQPIDAEYSAPIPTDQYAMGVANSNGVKQAAVITMRAATDENGDPTAAVYSPLYREGIGDIYFDAINFASLYVNSHIAVEVAKMLVASGDATSFEEETDWAKFDWERVPCDVFKVNKNGTFEKDNRNIKAKEVLLYSTAGYDNMYFRIRVPVNYHGPVRFRIVRTGEMRTAMIDYQDIISIDNIVVSYPVPEARLLPTGIEANGTAKANIGRVGAFTEPLLSVGLTDVKPRMNFTAETNGLPSFIDWKVTVDSADVVWRWRYLEQAFGPWKTNALSMAESGKEMVANEAIAVTNVTGDLEYYYIANVMGTHYKFQDFANDTPIDPFADADAFVKLKYPDEDRNKESGETNYWSRIREGASLWQEMHLISEVYTNSDMTVSVTNDWTMELIEDHTWRGFVSTPTNYTGKVAHIRFVGKNLWETNAVAPSVSSKTWYFPPAVSESDTIEIPMGGVAFSELGGNEERDVPLDCGTGYLMFEFNDESGAFTLNRAEYQDFNIWTPKDGKEDRYLGDSEFTNGVSSAKQVYAFDLSGLDESQASSGYWWENFDNMAGSADYPFNEPFGKNRITPNGWVADSGMFVNGMFSAVTNKETLGMAVQLQGRGIGSISLIDPIKAPHGIGTVSFSARLAQYLEFEDFFCYEDGGASKDYAISAKATMTSQKDLYSDISTGSPSLSLINYYRASQGCYEFRITRVYGDPEKYGTNKDNDGVMEMTIYKWYEVVDPETRETSWACKPLNSLRLGNNPLAPTIGRNYTNQSAKAYANYLVPQSTLTNTNNVPDNRYWTSVYFAAYNTSSGTYLEGGLAGIPTDAVDARDDIVNSSKKLMMSISVTDDGSTGNCKDTGPYFKKGTYGICSRECPAAFGNIQKHNLTGKGPYSNGRNASYFGNGNRLNPGDDGYTENDHFVDGAWGSSVKGRMTTFEKRKDALDGKDYFGRYDYGVCTVPLKQQLYLRYSPRGSSANWQDSGLKLNLTSYVLTNVVFSPHTTSQTNNIQIAVGGNQGDARTDVVVDDLQLSQWAGESSPLTMLGSMTDWAYTDSWISGTTNNVYQSAGASTNNEDSVAFISDCGYYMYKVEDTEDEYIYVFTNTVNSAWGYANITPKADITIEEVFVLGGGGGGGPGGGGGGGGSALWITNAVDYYAGETGLQVYVGPGGSGGEVRYSNNALTPGVASDGGTSYVRMKNPLDPTGATQQYCGYGGGHGGAFHKSSSAGTNGAGSGGAGGGSACKNSTRAKGYEIYGAGYGGAANDGAPGGGGGGGLRGIGDGGGNSASGNAADPRSVISAGADGMAGVGNSAGGKGGNGFELSAMGDSPIRTAIGNLLGNVARLGGGGGGGGGKNTTSATITTYGNGADSPGPGGSGGGGKGGNPSGASYSSYQAGMGVAGTPCTGGGGGGGAFKNPVTSGSSTANNWILGGGAGGSGLVVMRVKMKNKFILFQPMRGDVTKPMSVRTLFMDGISLLGFSWRWADTNAILRVQLATNDVNRQTISDLTTGFRDWTDICTINFKNMPETVRESGSTNISIGLRSPVSGLVRVMVDPSVVTTARNNATNELFDAMYGAVSITAMRVLDEPPLDDRSWWGWNIMPSQQAKHASLYDRGDLILGRSCALNFSGAAFDEASDPEEENPLFANPDGEYSTHDPFVQTPRFTNSIGQIMFKARVLETNLTHSAWVTISGCKNPQVIEVDDTNWTVLTNIEITADTTIFRPYQWRIPSAYSEYESLRLSTFGAAKGRGSSEVISPPAERVLIDEVLVLQPMRPQLQLKNAYPFRRNVDFKQNDTANYGKALPPNLITSTDAQPLLNEEFGLQVQVIPAGMADELDASSIEVYMDWYVGQSPWGARNWISEPSAVRNIRLAKAVDWSEGNLVYRSDPDDIAAFIPAQLAGDNGYQVVQYRIWARYKDKNGNQQDDHEITGSEWKTPGWYDPIDYNRTSGGAFSAYTILDTISPKRAWFNEINMYQYGDLNDDVHQYIEIAAPQGYDLTGWSVSAVQHGGGYTLVPLVDLGYNGVSSLKTEPSKNNYVFYGIQSPKTKEAGTYNTADHNHLNDGAWKSSAFSSGTENIRRACAMRLLRPTGIIEHEVIFMCTNTSTSRMAWTYDGTNFLKLVQENVKTGNVDPWFYAGADDKAGSRGDYSLGVYFDHGEKNTWTNEMVQTPGKVNELANGTLQEIDPDYFDPPTGTNLWIYATIDADSVSTLSMRVGNTNTTTTVLIVPQDRLTGTFSTSIVYQVVKWFDIASIVTNMAGEAGGPVAGPFEKATDGTWTLNLSNMTLPDTSSRRFYVKASAKNSARIPGPDDPGGISPDDPYYPAVVAWLQDFDEGEIKLAQFVGLDNQVVTNLNLKEMYWLDIPPVSPNSPDQWSEWIFKAGMGNSNNNGASTIGTVPSYTPDGAKLTNVLVTVTMMISNRCDEVNGVSPVRVYPPYTLRGLEPGSVSSNYNEKTATHSWTSVTFKVKGALQNGKVQNWYRPLRWFTFGPNSFGESGDPFSRTIEIHDPFSTASPGYTYDWEKYRGTPIFYRCAIDEELGPITVYQLNDDNALLTPTNNTSP